MSVLATYKASSGRLEPVWTVEIQTLPEETDRILDAVMQVHPLSFGRYQRNASISAVGKETAQPEPGSTTTTHVEGFVAGCTETYSRGGVEDFDRARFAGVGACHGCDYGRASLRGAGDFRAGRLGQSGGL